MSPSGDKNLTSSDEERSPTMREDVIVRKKPRMKRGEYPVTQEQVDSIVQNELSGIRFSVKPRETEGKQQNRHTGQSLEKV